MTTPKPEPALAKAKPKGRAGRTFPVTFVVDQQLEACVHAISHNPRRSNVQIDLHDEHNDADRVDFSAALFHDGIPMTHVWGTLRRWQGTSTRVEGHARTLNSDLTRSTWWAAITFTIFILISGFLMLLNTVESQPNPPTDFYWIFVLPFFPVVLYVGVILMVGLFNAVLNKRRLTQRLRKLFLAEPVGQSRPANARKGAEVPYAGASPDSRAMLTELKNKSRGFSSRDKS